MLAAGPAVPGVLGSVATVLDVRPGYEVAVAAALGAVADAAVVDDLDAAVAAVAHLRAQDGGRAGLLVSGGPALVDPTARPELPDGAAWALDLVSAPEGLVAAVGRALDRIAVVGTAEEASTLVAARARGASGHPGR